MPKHLVATVCVLISALGTPRLVDVRRFTHTMPPCWREPRFYHQPETEPRSNSVRVGSVPLTDPPNKTLSPNKVYWFAPEWPGFSRPGPWTTRLLIFNERRTLVQLSFVDHANSSFEISWVNEKLLFIRVPWGRIRASDLIFDVETGRFVYRESHEWGGIEFEQWKAQGEPCVVPSEQFSK
jgi:hypothetical protein